MHTHIYSVSVTPCIIRTLNCIHTPTQLSVTPDIIRIHTSTQFSETPAIIRTLTCIHSSTQLSVTPGIIRTLTCINSSTQLSVTPSIIRTLNCIHTSTQFSVRPGIIRTLNCEHSSTQLSVTQNISLHSVFTADTPTSTKLPPHAVALPALIPMQYQALFNFLSATMMHDRGKNWIQTSSCNILEFKVPRRERPC